MIRKSSLGTVFRLVPMHALNKKESLSVQESLFFTPLEYVQLEHWNHSSSFSDLLISIHWAGGKEFRDVENLKEQSHL